MQNSIEAQLKERITAFVHELDSLVRRSTLDSLQSLLGGGAAPVRRGRPATGGRGSADVESAASAIVAHVRAHDGQGIGEIAAGAGVALKVAKKVAARLLATGALRKSGQKRGTRYHLGSGSAAPARIRTSRRKA